MNNTASVIIGVFVIVAFIKPLFEAINRTLDMRKITKDAIILKITPLKPKSGVSSLIYGIIILLLSLLAENIGKALLMAAGLGFILIPINRSIEIKKSGIYAKGIVYPGTILEWKEIEAYAITSDSLRLIHKKAGAFEFCIEIDEIRHFESILVAKEIPKIRFN